MDFQQAHFFLYTKDKLTQRKYRDQAELVRLQTFILMQPHLTKKINKPSDLMPFEWDNIIPIAPPKIEESDYMQLDKMFANRKKRLFK